MILHIHDNKTISDLQDKFNECFPSLKIEFYDQAHHYKEKSSDSHLISADRTIGSISKKHEQGEFVIKSWDTVASVEREFREKYGLNVQVFRKQNDKWIQTSATDPLTLRQQGELSV